MDRALAQELVEALENAQKALAMLVSHEAIKVTLMFSVFAFANEAESKARRVIEKAKSALASPTDQQIRDLGDGQ